MYKIHDMLNHIHWTGQASLKIEADNKIIYIDPYKLTHPEKADIIFITHEHFDHMSPDDLRNIIKPDTKVIAPKSCVEKLSSIISHEVITVEPGYIFKLDGINIEVVPAYNTEKEYHPKVNKWVGYVLTIDGVKIYHAGDTNRIPEMKKITCDIVFLPLGQTYTMDSVEEAVEAAMDVKAKIAVPFHYGMYEGTLEDARKFKSLLEEKGIEVVIMNKE